MADQMVVIGGVRYRREDAKQRGLLKSEPKHTEKAAPAAEPVKPANKSRRPAAK